MTLQEDSCQYTDVHCLKIKMLYGHNKSSCMPSMMTAFYFSYESSLLCVQTAVEPLQIFFNKIDDAYLILISQNSSVNMP